MKTGEDRRGVGWFAAVLLLCAPSLIFVLATRLPKVGGDVGELVRAFGAIALVIASFPMTAVAVIVACWATLKRTVDWQLKVLIWMAIAVSVLALIQINAAVRGIGV